MSKAETHPEIREAVRKLCARFPGPYWRALDRERAYPTEFVTALTEAGWLSVLIPEQYGGAGLGLEAVIGLAKNQTGRGIEAGLAIVLLAMVLDRLTQKTVSSEQ